MIPKHPAWAEQDQPPASMAAHDCRHEVRYRKEMLAEEQCNISTFASTKLLHKVWSIDLCSIIIPFTNVKMLFQLKRRKYNVLYSNILFVHSLSCSTRHNRFRAKEDAYHGIFLHNVACLGHKLACVLLNTNLAERSIILWAIPCNLLMLETIFSIWASIMMTRVTIVVNGTMVFNAAVVWFIYDLLSQRLEINNMNNCSIIQTDQYTIVNWPTGSIATVTHRPTHEWPTRLFS